MAEEVWMLQTKKADFKQIGARFRIDPVTARIIRNRGIEGEAAIDRYLNGTLDDLYDPMLLKDMEHAVSILCEAVDTGKKIRIVGDYDIDGVCSTYILLQAFERLGSDVDFEIPDRIKDGYGINESIIEQAHADGVEVILTCDNGISAFHQVELAKKYGMTVVITDHHEVPLDGEKEKIPPIRNRQTVRTHFRRSAAQWWRTSWCRFYMPAGACRRWNGWICLNLPRLRRSVM